MKRNIMNEAEKLIKAHRRKKRWYQAVTCLAGIVVFCTVYSLILPAITMEKYQCGIEEHTHTQECYDAESGLICGLEEHVHTDACVRSEETAENGIQETADTTTENTGNAATSDNTETENAGSETENTESDTTQEDTETTVDTGTSETEKTTENTEDTKTDETAQDAETQEEWEATFQSVELTGKYPEDVLAIAKTQIGYTESTENYVTDEAGEDRGYTRYGQWYGEPYGEWSGMFASFCLHYAGVEGMPLSDDCEEWIKELSKEEYSLYHEASDTEYEPVPGDLVFFDLDGDTKADHTGIISEVNISETENELKTIEGDWEDKVQTVTRSVDDEKILGYGALPEQEKEEEQTEENAQAQDFELSVETESGITVTVSGSGDALPYPADEVTLKAEEIKDQEAVDIQSKALEDAGLESEKEYLFDITLWHEEEEIEPTGTVTVGFEGFDTEGTEAKVYHIDEKKDRAEDMEATVDDEGTVVLDTDHFSVYGVALLERVAGTAISGDQISQITNGGEFYLTGDAWYGTEGQGDSITITKDTVLDLNGYGVYYKGWGNFLQVQSGATLTIKDSKAATVNKNNVSGNNYNNLAQIDFDGTKPSKLTYYITDSAVSEDGISTIETLWKYEVTNMGFIVGEYTYGADSVVDVSSGGTFNLEGGLLTIKNSSSFSGASNIISNAGTLNISGGYVCGGADTASSNGGGIYTTGQVTMQGGVIAANKAKNGGGVYVNSGSFTMMDGIISGNQSIEMIAWTFDEGFGGGGIFAKNSTVKMSGGYITNNSAIGDCGQVGAGCHGGGGIATTGGSFAMTGGTISGNYSSEAGGGLYMGHFNIGQEEHITTSFEMSGGKVVGNIAESSEGGGIRVSGYTNATFQKSTGGENIYITNNETRTENDWGGGGVFVQAQGNLVVYEALITDNTAHGFGGGVAACPTGRTLVVNERGAAIYDNDADGIARSGGTRNKNDDSATIGEDANSYGTIDHEFVNKEPEGCYQDYYTVKKEADDTITLVMGEMLGGHAANWQGRIDGQPVSISKTGYKPAKWLCGLTANPDESGKQAAINSAGIFITGNKSSIHGGGIMSNGNLILGNVDQVETVNPALDITGSKAVTKNGQAQTGRLEGFEFILLKQEPQKTDGKWTYTEDDVIGTAITDENGKFILSTNTTYNNTGNYTYYLIEDSGSSPDIEYDQTVYRINVTIAENTTTVLGIKFVSYYVSNVTVEKKDADDQNYTEFADFTTTQNSDESYTLAFNGTTFTNKIKPDLKIKLVKVDSADAQKALAGAEFKLKEAESAENGTTAKTQADGSVEFTGIQRGVTYYLYEVTPPEGYSGSGPWIIEVGNDGNAKIYPAQDVGNGKLEKMPGEEGTQLDVSGTDTSTYTITLSTNISNELITYELPETGGAGTKLYTMGGLLLIMGAGSILLYRSKKGRGGASS